MADREMTSQEAIEILGGIRACYNIFDGYDEPKYAALSKAIFALKAVPVVRCKDCKYNYANMIPGGKGCQQNVYIEVDDNFFCADGERKDEVEE